MTSNTANTSSAMNLFLFCERPRTSPTSSNDDHTINLAPFTAVIAPNQQHGRGMLHRARDDTSASQGGHTEAYPPTTKNGKYQHDNIITFGNAVRRVLKTFYNPSNPGNSMMKLLNSSTGVPTSTISGINFNSVSTIATVLATATRKAAAATAALGPGAAYIAPTITTRKEAQDEANRLNLNCQAVIGAKEGSVTAITDNVGSDVTDIVLSMVNGDDFRVINNYKPHKIASAEITGADRPATSIMLEHLVGVLGHAFNFQQKVNTNMDLIWACAARIQSYGITFDDAQITLVLLANIERAKISITAAISVRPSKKSAARSRITTYTTRRC